MIDNKSICLEKNAHRCQTCGTTENVNAYQLIEGDMATHWHISNLAALCGDCHKAKINNEQNFNPDVVGVLCAGGRGSRLFPITNYLNKHTLPVGTVPMIVYPLKTLRDFGIKRALIILDRQNSNAIIEMLGSGSAYGMELSYKVQEGAFGIAHALSLAEDFVKEETKIVAILGDNIFGKELDTSLDISDNKAVVYLKEVSDPAAYGVADIKDEKVTRIVEKPKEFISNLAVVGLYIYDKQVFDIIRGIEPSPRGELEVSTVNDFFCKQGKLSYKLLNNTYWQDAGGSIEKYCQANIYGGKQANLSKEKIEELKCVVFDEK